MSNTLVFNFPDVVTNVPTVDGFVFADIGVTTAESEPGYVNGARLELGSSGLAPVVVTAIQDTAVPNTLVIGVMCRGDVSFDDVDMVMLAFRGVTGAQRRIEIKPNWGDPPNPPIPPAVFDPAHLGTGYGAADPDPANANIHLSPLPNPPVPPAIQTNKPPHGNPVYYQRGGPSGNWSPASAPTGFDVKVRSWRPLVTVDSPSEFAWSIELRVPIDVATGGAGWIDLGDDFGIFINVMRAWRYVDAGDLSYDWTQYKFPPTAADLTGIINETTDIPAASFARGLKGGMATQGEGVRIKNGSMGIGCRLAGSSALQGTISGTVDNTIVAQLDNTGAAASGIVAEVRMANWGLGPPQFNSWALAPGCANPSGPAPALVAGTPASPSAMVETGNAWLAANVPPDYATHPHQCMWVQLRATGSPVVFTQASARRNMDFVGLSDVARDAEISAVGYPPPADGSGDQEFMLRTRCRKVVISELIGKGDLGAETSAIIGGALQFAMQTGLMGDPQHVPVEDVHTRVNAGGRQATMFKDKVVYLWITEGLRRTHQTMEIDGHKGEIWDNSPGDFSLAAFHTGVDDNLGWQFSGGGLIKHGDGTYGIKVKDGQTATIGVKLSASRDTKPGDLSDLPRNFPGEDGSHGGGDGGKNGGCGKQLLALALLPTGAYLLGQMFA